MSLGYYEFKLLRSYAISYVAENVMLNCSNWLNSTLSNHSKASSVMCMFYYLVYK